MVILRTSDFLNVFNTKHILLHGVDSHEESRKATAHGIRISFIAGTMSSTCRRMKDFSQHVPELNRQI